MASPPLELVEETRGRSLADYSLDVDLPGAPWDAAEGDCAEEVIGKEGTLVSLERKVYYVLMHCNDVLFPHTDNF